MKYSSSENKHSFIIPPKICVEFVKEKLDKWKFKISSKNIINNENGINHLIFGLNYGKEDLIQTATSRKIKKVDINPLSSLSALSIIDEKETLKKEKEKKRIKIRNSKKESNLNYLKKI